MSEQEFNGKSQEEIMEIVVSCFIDRYNIGDRGVQRSLYGFFIYLEESMREDKVSYTESDTYFTESMNGGRKE